MNFKRIVIKKFYINKEEKMNEYLDKASSNLVIYDSFVKAESMLS